MQNIKKINITLLVTMRPITNISVTNCINIRYIESQLIFPGLQDIVNRVLELQFTPRPSETLIKALLVKNWGFS